MLKPFVHCILSWWCRVRPIGYKIDGTWYTKCMYSVYDLDICLQGRHVSMATFKLLLQCI